ncbi:hypothetical protein KC320_g5847 [Hortaea werneckii]|nr:hypothetical protein KC320_g5847 [Hortaea werneckii]
MAGDRVSQQSPPKNQTSSPSTAATNTSNAANAQESTVPPAVNNFRDLSFSLWKSEGDSGKGPVLGGIHSNAPPSQHQDQTHPEAARTTDNDDSNGTAGKLPQSFDSTAQHLSAVKAGTSSSTTAARHGEGFVGKEISDSVLPDLTNTDQESLSQARFNSRGPSSRPPYANTDVLAPENEDRDSDEALIEQAIAESSATITRAYFSVERKRYLLLKVAVMLQRKGEGYPEIAELVDRVNSFIKKTSLGDLGRKLPFIVKKLDHIKVRLDQLIRPSVAPVTADESRKRKALNVFGAEEHEQPSVKKHKPAKTQDYRRKQRSADPVVIVDHNFGFATDLERRLERVYEDALVVSTDGSFCPTTRHAGAGAAWQTAVTDAGGLSSGKMEWNGFAWLLGVNYEIWLSNYAERIAIKLALEMIMDLDLLDGRKKVVIQSDSKTALQLIETQLSGNNAGSRTTRMTVSRISELRSWDVDIAFVWVKGHHCCAGNRIADVLAGHGRCVSEQGFPPVDFSNRLYSHPSRYSQAAMRVFADYSYIRSSRKAEHNASAPAGPPTDESQLSTRKIVPQATSAARSATHVLQESRKSVTTKDRSLPHEGTYTSGTPTSSAPVANLPGDGSHDNGNTKAATTGSQLLDATHQSVRLNKTGATASFASFNLADEEQSSEANGNPVAEAREAGEVCF